MHVSSECGAIAAARDYIARQGGVVSLSDGEGCKSVSVAAAEAEEAPGPQAVGCARREAVSVEVAFYWRP